ncbi:MAG TPA: PQQ-binding-like beta-propeller repeat protein [Gaiellaceae bacterium]|nr:PQQ-binding-like beta-propeller repeat protein [Gaiellaceae bacterium]
MRLRRATLTLAIAALGGFAWWVVHDFVPLRDGATGALASGGVQARTGSTGSPWPMFGASPARTRFVASKLRPPFRPVYTIPGRGLIEMPPIVSRGLVVFGTHDGLVIASRVDDGTIAWTADIDGCIASSPAVRAGVVYVGWAGPAPCARGKGERGGVVALGLESGRLLWRFGTGNVESSPAVVADRLFFSAFRSRQESRVYSMKLGAGRHIVWSYPLATKIASSPALLGRKLYVSAYDRYLYSFDAWSGRLRWKTTSFSDDAEVRVLLGFRSLVRRRSWREGGYYATPSIAHDRAYLGVIDGVFSAFDVHTGAHRWSRKLAGSIYGSAAVWNETVYVGTTDGIFYALSAHDGHMRWKQRLGGKVLGSPTVTGGRVYISTTNRETFVLHARTGVLDWRFADGYYSPLVVAGSRAFLVGKGRIYALENAPRIRPPLVPNAS